MPRCQLSLFRVFRFTSREVTCASVAAYGLSLGDYYCSPWVAFPMFCVTPPLRFIILCFPRRCLSYILSPCFFQTSFPAICGPSSLMYRTLIYAIWLTSYPKLSLVQAQIILNSPISTALNDGAPGPPSFPRLLCYQLHPPMLPCTCLVSFKRPLLHHRSSQPCRASAGRTILLV